LCPVEWQEVMMGRARINLMEMLESRTLLSAGVPMTHSAPRPAAHTSYRFRVRAIDADQSSPWSTVGRSVFA
jgi:hypothetical protein